MKYNSRPHEDIGRSKGFFVPALIITAFSIEPPTVLIGLLLVDIGQTFGYSVGGMGQIRTISSLVSIITSLLMGALSVRYSHKSLLLAGLLTYIISAVGCGMSPSYGTMAFFFALTGLAYAIVVPMTITLVGDFLSQQERSSAIGSIISSRSLSYLVASPVLGFIAGSWGWRMGFLGYVLPISLLSFLIASRILPSEKREASLSKSRLQYLEGFKRVFSNHSAVACLLGTALSMAAWQGILFFSASFFRQHFLVSRNTTAIFVSVMAFCFMVSSYTSGHLTNKFGRKLLTVLGVFVFSLFTFAYTNLDTLWIALILTFLGGAFSGISYTAYNSLTLEQVPEFRGTMMSLSAASMGLGMALGSGLGGLIFLKYGWRPVGPSLGAIGIFASMIFYFLTKDPTQEKQVV